MACRWLAVVLAVMVMAVRSEEVDAAPEPAAVPDDAAPEPAAVPDDAANVTNDMRPPEIDVGGLTGLLVGGLLLTVFAIGFLTLFAIQTPQRFEVPEKDSKNKAQ